MKKDKVLNFFQKLSRQVAWILEVFKTQVAGTVKEYSPLLLKLERVYKTRGQSEMINYIKSLRTALLNYLSGNKTRVKGIKLTKQGVPKILVPLLKLDSYGESPIERLRIILTILYSTRALNLGTNPDTSSITSVGVSLPTDIMKYGKSFWRELGYRPSQTVPKSLNFKAYHFSTKSGPNGHALWTSLQDLNSLPESLVTSIKTIGGEVISERIDCLLKSKHLLPFYLKQKPGKFRKLTWFPDKEEKIRIIAIVDYWSQTVLKPLHSYLNNVLKKIKQDRTFDQGAFKEVLKDKEIYYSIDLTAFTDRFPMLINTKLLKCLLPETYVNAWQDIMVGYPFEFTNKDKKESLSYQVGNPMGAYSSWPSTAVAHHYIMYFCCRELGISWSKSEYCLLGDDIVIANKELGEKYLAVIKSLGVEVSALKTHTSPKLYEFAKRLIYKGQEITPFPISALAESESRSYIMTNLLLEVRNKEWITSLGIPSSVSEYYSIVKRRPSRYMKDQFNNAYISELMLSCIRGSITAQDCLNAIKRHNKIRVRDLTLEEGQGILSSLAVEAFADSNPENDKTGKHSLGYLAETLVCHFTGFEDPVDCELGFQLIYALPLLGAYALIEEMFMNMKREARRIDTVAGGDWPLLMKTMALPLDDKIFVRRQSHLIAQASAIVGKKVVERLQFLSENAWMLG